MFWKKDWVWEEIIEAGKGDEMIVSMLTWLYSGVWSIKRVDGLWFVEWKEFLGRNLLTVSRYCSVSIILGEYYKTLI